MTVSVQIPYTFLLGNGVLTRFAFTFDAVENMDIFVFRDNVATTDFVVENRTSQGGDVVFPTAPDSGEVVAIYRGTTFSQQVDYETDEAFQAETHEFGLDKLMFICQELLFGFLGGIDPITGLPFILSFDLSITQSELTVTVNNSGGTDAVLPPWGTGLAGLFHGEITATPPSDEDLTTEADGHVWIEV